jgi:hypothetical protein
MGGLALVAYNADIASTRAGAEPSADVEECGVGLINPWMSA